jgi:hypothetical protein
VNLPNDIIGLHDGRTMLVHMPTACEGRACCIHNPSMHVLDTAPLTWRSDTRTMERVCPHGIGHPDPDDLAWKRVELGDDEAWGFGIHGCDGCCRSVTQ